MGTMRFCLSFGAFVFLLSAFADEAADADAAGAVATACETEIEPKVLALMKAKGERSVGKLLQAHDNDGDGHVSVDEIRSFFVEVGVSDSCVDLTEHSIKHLMEAFDADSSGSLSHAEIDELMKEHRHGEEM